MAIKGKKKSQKRGGQTKRRPAAAPRPAAAGRPVPWYKTAAFRVTAIVVLAVLGGVVLVLIQNARDDARALEERQEQLDGYTDDVRALVQAVRPHVTGMAAVQPGMPKDQLAKIEKDARSWAKGLTKSQTDVQTLRSVPGTREITPLFAQSLQLYTSAARTYALALDMDGNEQGIALATAADIRAQAGSIWSLATVMLDDVRGGAEMEPSGLTPPDPAAAGAVPGAQPPVPGGVPEGVPEELPGEVPGAPGGGGG